ncbi:DNA polymerase III subunit delta [Alicyclobacillus pomorum]|uniref:DNA polymerase III subunit delta n=1 Tax=Alicyclobacillus pomorum TaxID=204470 RepID=UPI00040AFE93|nr:DNA polymerase III subunit delta [Alicyclobacillus pomorum]
MLDWSQAIESLQAATDIAPVHVLVGTDFILSRWYLDKLEHVLASVEHMPVDVNRFRFDEEGCAGAVQACQTLSLFSDTGIVHLDHCSAFLSGGKSKHDLTDLERYLEHPASGKVLVITVHGEKLDERKKIVKLARKHTVVNCNPPKENVALQWLATVCDERGISLANDAARELWRRTQTLSSAVSELEKLYTYTGGQPISLRDVQELVSQPVEDNVFAWIDGVVKGRVDRSFRVLTDVERAGYDAFALYALIARQLRLMWYAKVLGAKGYSNQQIASKAGAHPYAVKVASEQARALTQTQIERLLSMVADAEYAVKTGRRDPRHSLDWVLMACSVAK